MGRTVPAADLCRVIHRIVGDRDLAMRFRDGALAADELAGIGGDDLAADEAAALAERDLPRLYALGAHPILLFHLSAIAFPRSHYITNVVPALAGVANPYYDYYRMRPERTGDGPDRTGDGEERTGDGADG